ncbi:MAG: tetratricopeptide repeat protein [Candidatus Rifleibacteriota bacterium]
MNSSKLITAFIVFLFFSSTYSANCQFSNELESDVSVRDLLENYERNPKAETYYLMALAETQKNNIEKAEKAIKTGLAINPRSVRLLNLKGAIKARQGQPAAARRIFLGVLQLDPENEYAQTSLRSVEKQLQPRRKRLPLLEKSPDNKVDSSPDSPLKKTVKKPKVEKKILQSSYFEEVKDKQNCYYGMASIDRAYKRYLDSNPTNKEFSLNKLTEEGYLTSKPICPDSGQYSYNDSDVVCSEHGNKTELGGEVTSVFNDYNRGIKAKLSHNYLDALKAFEQVVVLYPRWAEAHYQLGDTLFRLGEADAAMVSLRKCLKHNPDNLDAKLLLANIYFKVGQKSASLKILDEIIKEKKGTVYGLSAKSIARSIRSGRNYYQVFPPN